MLLKKFGIWGNVDKQKFWDILPNILSWSERKNLTPLLTKRIAAAINQEVILSNDLGYDIQAIESMAFAWMGYKRINNQVMKIQLGKDKFNKGLLGSITKAIP